MAAGNRGLPDRGKGAGGRRLRVLAPWVALAAVIAGTAAAWPWLQATRYLNSARAALARGELRLALRRLRAAQRWQPRRPEVQYLLAVANRRAGRLDVFAVHLAKARELGWSESDLQRQEWLATAQTGDVPAVLDQVMSVIDQGAPDDVAEEIYEAIAKGHMSVYRLRDAWICLDVWLQWRPDAPQARLMRASIYEQLGDLKSAAADYRAVLQQYPADREARMRLGHVLLDDKEFEAARAEYEAWLAVDPADGEAMVYLAQCERAMGLAERAAEHVDRALELDPPPRAKALALGEKGRILLDQGKVEEAVQTLYEAVEMAPMEPGLHFALGTALARAGRTEAARYHHQRMREIRLEFGRMTEITRRLLREPFNAELRCEAGEILMRQGLKREGADWLRTALRCNPRHAKAHALMAEFCAEQGDMTLAGEHRLLAAQSATSLPASKSQ